MGVPMPERYPLRWVLAIVAILALSWAALAIKSCVKSHQAVSANRQAEIVKEAARAEIQTAQQADGRAADRQPTLDARDRKIASLQALVARLRAQSPASAPDPDPVPDPAGDPDPRPDCPVDPESLRAAQDALIDAQGRQISDLKAQVLDLTTSRDGYKAALAKTQLEANLREVAYQAQVAAVKASRLRGRLEGAVFALAVDEGGRYLVRRFR